MKRLLISLFVYFLSQHLAYSQNRSFIDSLLLEVNIHYRNGDIESTVKQAFQIFELSEAINYEHGVVRATIYIADCLSRIGAYEKSIVYIDKLENHKNHMMAKPYDYWLVQKIQLENYRYLGLTSLLNKQFETALETIALETDSLKRAIGLFNTYLIGANGVSTDLDTIYFYLLMAKKVVDGNEIATDNPEYVNQNRGIIYVILGDFHLKNDNFDSAHYYYKTADSLLFYTDSIVYKADLNDGFGNLFEKMNLYERALGYKLKALDLYSQMNFSHDIQRTYFDLHKIYLKLDSAESALSYLELYNQIKSKVETEKNKGVDAIILSSIEKEEMTLTKAKEKSRNRIIAIF